MDEGVPTSEPSWILSRLHAVELEELWMYERCIILCRKRHGRRYGTSVQFNEWDTMDTHVKSSF